MKIGWRCPKCGSEGFFDIQTLAHYEVDAETNEWTLVRDIPDFSKNSILCCLKLKPDDTHCAWSGTVEQAQAAYNAARVDAKGERCANNG